MSSHLQPFEHHDASPESIEDLVARFGALANKAIDLNVVSDAAFQPAVAHWDGVCAPELRAAPEPVRYKALSTSSDLAWSAVALQLWADRVRVFNQAVDDIQADLAEARHTHYGA